MQAVFVMAPLVYPLLLVWLRTAHSSPTFVKFPCFLESSSSRVWLPFEKRWLGRQEKAIV